MFYWFHLIENNICNKIRQYELFVSNLIKYHVENPISCRNEKLVIFYLFTGLFTYFIWLALFPPPARAANFSKLPLDQRSASPYGFLLFRIFVEKIAALENIYALRNKGKALIRTTLRSHKLLNMKKIIWNIQNSESVAYS